MSHHKKQSVRDEVIGKKSILFIEKYTPHGVWAISKVRVAINYILLKFLDSGSVGDKLQFLFLGNL